MNTRLEIKPVACALAAHAAGIARALLGEPNRVLSNRRELRFRRKGSLAVVIEGVKSGQWYDHEAGIGGDLISLIQRARGATFYETVAYAEQFIGSAASIARKPPPAARSISAEYDSRLNHRYAGGLWREAGSIDGTPAAAYLEWRHVLLPALEVGHEVLRFHRSCPFGGDRHPCLLALRRDIRTDEPRAIQRIALPDMRTIQEISFTEFAAADGQIARRTLGPKSGTAIKLSLDVMVTRGLTVGEGLETVLAGMVKGFRPAWALGDASSVSNFAALSGIEVLSILVDNDADGPADDVHRVSWQRIIHRAAHLGYGHCCGTLTDPVRRPQPNLRLQPISPSAPAETSPQDGSTISSPCRRLLLYRAHTSSSRTLSAARSHGSSQASPRGLRGSGTAGF
jgi:putative DNA primase/helicase